MLIYRQGRIISVSLSFPNSGQEMHILQKQIDQKKKERALVQWYKTTDERRPMSRKHCTLMYSSGTLVEDRGSVFLSGHRM
jgi:hypothetical protein